MMKLLYLVLIAAPALAHYHAPAQKCHLEWQEVVTPHCTTTNEQVHLKILLNSFSDTTNAHISGVRG